MESLLSDEAIRDKTIRMRGVPDSVSRLDVKKLMGRYDDKDSPRRKRS